MRTGTAVGLVDSFVPRPLNEPCPSSGAFCGAKDDAVYNNLHNLNHASDLCDLGLCILFRSGRCRTRTCDFSRVKVLIRFSPDDATRR